ncbi:kinase-like protein, partial [Trametes sanguinea]
LQRRLGTGTFGSVFRAVDIMTGSRVAVKLLHRIEGRVRDVHHEERAYDALVAGCSPRLSLFAEVFGSGTHQGFSYTVFELCDATLCDVIKGAGKLTPLCPRHICEIAYQIVSGIEYMHSLGIVHADIKPDNIAFKRLDTVLVQSIDNKGNFQSKRILASTALRIIDLGSSMTVTHATSSPSIVCAKIYRAPEVDLRLPWSFGVDVFAVGCVIAETYLLENLFHPKVETDFEHLAMIDRICGPFPRDFAKSVEALKPGIFRLFPRVEVIFPCADVPLEDEANRSAVRRLESMKRICARVHNAVLADLLRKLLMPDPSRRLSMAAAVRHPYFDGLDAARL